MVRDLLCFDDLEEKEAWSVNQLINDGGIYRTALGTPGLFKSFLFGPQGLVKLEGGGGGAGGGGRRKNIHG